MTRGTIARDNRRDGFTVVVVVAPGDQRETLRKGVLHKAPDGPADVVIDLRLLRELTDPDLVLLVDMSARQEARQHQFTLVCLADSQAEQSLRDAGLTRQLLATPG